MIWRRPALSHPLTPWLLWVVATAVTTAGASPTTALSRGFFAVIMVGGAVGLAALAGRRVQLAVAGIALALLLAQRVLPARVDNPPSSLWTQVLSRPAQAIRHTIALPAGSPSWENIWRRASQAAVYLCARGPLDAATVLDLQLNGTSLGTVTQAQAIGPRPQPDSVGFYRIPVARAALEQNTTATFSVRLVTGPDARPVEVCGTFTYRPSAGRESSAFFDGSTWTSPGPTMHGRFLIELRFEDATGKIVEALY